MRIDRRPVRALRPFIGTSHPWGLRTECQNPSTYVSWLLGELDRLHELGFQRFVLRVPAGRPKGQRSFGNAHWWTLPDEVRSDLHQLTLWLHERPEVIVAPYWSFLIGSPYSHHQEEPRIPYRRRANDRNVMTVSTEPWLSLSPTSQPYQIGLGFDAASQPDRRKSFVDWSKHFEKCRIWSIGEAIPRDSSGRPDHDYCVAARWYATFDWIERRDPGVRDRNSLRAWTFDPAVEEIHVALLGDDPADKATVVFLHDLGYVLQSWDNSHDEVVLDIASRNR